MQYFSWLGLTAAALTAITDGLCAVHLNGLIINALHPLPSGAGVLQFYSLLAPESQWHTFGPSDRLISPDNTPASTSVGPPFVVLEQVLATPTAGETNSSRLVSSAAAGPSGSAPQAHQEASGSTFSAAASANHEIASAPPQASAGRAEGYGLFTVFDFPGQIIRRLKQPHWTDQDCLQDTITHAWLTAPQAHILADPVPGFQLPQILLYQATILATHQPLVVVFQGERTHPFVCHLPIGSSLTDFFQEVRFGPGDPGHGVLNTPGGFTCAIRGEPLHCALPVPRDVSVIYVRAARASDPRPHFATAGTGDTELSALVRLEADRAATFLLGEGPHTCFDVLVGPRFRGQFAHWAREDCRADCEISARHIPSPVGRLLVHEVEGLPSPQTVVTSEHLVSTHRCFVLDLRAIGFHVAAVSAPHEVPLHEPLSFLDADTWRSLRSLFASRLGFRFFVNGALANPALPLPSDTDVVCIFPPASPDSSPDVADTASAIWDDPASTSTTTTNMPTGQAASSSSGPVSSTTAHVAPFLDIEEDGVVPASLWWGLRGPEERRGTCPAREDRRAR